MKRRMDKTISNPYHAVAAARVRRGACQHRWAGSSIQTLRLGRDKRMHMHLQALFNTFASSALSVRSILRLQTVRPNELELLRLYTKLVRDLSRPGQHSIAQHTL